MRWNRTRRLAIAAVTSLGLAAMAIERPVQAAAAAPSTGVVAQMKIAGINDGNPTTILSFSLGATDTATVADGSGAGVGKVSFANLTVSKGLDADSVPLLQAASTGQVLKSVVIDVFAGHDTVPFATYTFEDVLVTSNVIGAANSSTNEQDAFDFRRITSDVTINGETFHSCFDVKAGTSC
jgi:type VI protein secretion system component Hcp